MRVRFLVALSLLVGCADDGGGEPFPDARFVPDAAFVPCEVDLECPAPAAGKLTVCGRIYDVEQGLMTSGFLHADFIDAAAFAADPTAAPHLDFDMYRYDACGRFIATALEVPASGGLTILVEDSPQGFPTDHTATAVSFEVEAGNAYGSIPAWSLASWSEQAWAAQIGLTSSVTYSGAALVIHTDGGAPVPGFPISIGAGTPQAAYGFSDTNTTSHYTLMPGVETTGLNGAELRLEQSIDVPGKTCVTQHASIVPGVLFVAYDEQSCYL